ncbi:MAG: hypothetical protein F6K56_16920 [Moorea sp. SIO3G5]|nr:hypothetical protein [Moorena sp. SIO3G5]
MALSDVMHKADRDKANQGMNKSRQRYNWHYGQRLPGDVHWYGPESLSHCTQLSLAAKKPKGRKKGKRAKANNGKTEIQRSMPIETREKVRRKSIIMAWKRIVQIRQM